MVKVKKSIDVVVNFFRGKKRKKRVLVRDNPAVKRKEDLLRAIIEKEMDKVRQRAVKKKPKAKDLEEIAGKAAKVKKFIEKEGITYAMAASYNTAPQLDYDTLFSYLGNMKTQQSLYGTYASIENSNKPSSDDGMDYATIAKIILNTKIGIMFGNYTRDGSIGTDFSPDASISQREKWNFISKTSFGWAISTCMYDTILG